MKLTNNVGIYAALTSVSILWGTSFAAAKIGMADLTPLNLAILRFIIASAIFACILPMMGHNNTIERKDIPRFIILGFLAITSYFYIQYTGLTYTTTINAALIIATSPIWTLLMGVILGLERITVLAAVGIVLAFAGVSIIITSGNAAALFQSHTLIGDLLLLLNAVVWAGFTVYGKQLLRKYHSFVAMAYIHIFGTLMLVPLAFITTAITPIPLIKQVGAISLTTLVSAAYLALLCSVYGYYIWYTGVDKIGAVRTSVFTYLNPLFAILTGIWLLKEQITLFILLGGILVIFGVYLANRFTDTKPQTSNELK